MAGEIENEDGSIALRSYGSMSYAGLLSFIYAEMDAKDPRVVAVREWLKKHYTIHENPAWDRRVYIIITTLCLKH